MSRGDEPLPPPVMTITRSLAEKRSEGFAGRLTSIVVMNWGDVLLEVQLKAKRSLLIVVEKWKLYNYLAKMDRKKVGQGVTWI